MKLILILASLSVSLFGYAQDSRDSVAVPARLESPPIYDPNYIHSGCSMAVQDDLVYVTNLFTYCRHRKCDYASETWTFNRNDIVATTNKMFYLGFGDEYQIGAYTGTLIKTWELNEDRAKLNCIATNVWMRVVR